MPRTRMSRSKPYRKSNHFVRKKPEYKLILENTEQVFRSYPKNTWAILRPVGNNIFIPFIYLTDTFNCLGKFPDSTSNHHQLPLDTQICDKHCYIRVHFTDNVGKSSLNIFLEDISKRGTQVDGILVKRDVKNSHPYKVKLNNGSKISFPGSRIEDGLYTYEFDIVDLESISTSKFDRKYKLGKFLGRGHFSSVYMTRCIKYDGKTYAVKIMDKIVNNDNSRQRRMVESEIQILNGLAHENLIKIYDFFDEPDKMYLVIEYVEDGEFFDFFKNRILSEVEIRIIFKQLFSAIEYLHERRIVHRDLKPENILMPSKEGLRIKVSDFGLSKLLNVDFSTMQTRCGTVSYVAPEILELCKDQSYTKEVDMWSAGVIFYACLCGQLPFTSESNRPNSVADKIKSGIFPKDIPRWENASESAKDLVCGLLNKSPFHRLSAKKALKHPFITCGGIPKQVPYSNPPVQHQFESSNGSSSSDDLYYSCVGQFSQLSTITETTGRSYVSESETIRSCSSNDNEISSPSINKLTRIRKDIEKAINKDDKRTIRRLYFESRKLYCIHHDEINLMGEGNNIMSSLVKDDKTDIAISLLKYIDKNKIIIDLIYVFIELLEENENEKIHHKNFKRSQMLWGLIKFYQNSCFDDDDLLKMLKLFIKKRSNLIIPFLQGMLSAGILPTDDFITVILNVYDDRVLKIYELLKSNEIKFSNDMYQNLLISQQRKQGLLYINFFYRDMLSLDEKGKLDQRGRESLQLIENAFKERKPANAIKSFYEIGSEDIQSHPIILFELFKGLFDVCRECSLRFEKLDESSIFSVYKFLLRKQFKINSDVGYYLMVGFLWNNQLNHAEQVLTDMINEKIIPPAYTFIPLVNSYLNNEKVDKVEKIMGLIKSMYYKDYIYLLNRLIDHYNKKGDKVGISRWMKELINAPINDGTGYVSSTVLLRSYGVLGKLSDVTNLWEEMNKQYSGEELSPSISVLLDQIGYIGNISMLKDHWDIILK
ncbi:15093_t:CDS:10 [Funneliformis mosseae]|uniref:15093_t:CDS:1 n=1 Tax=Funneliformis mosseae TaxID=27381 RepID=A0A9N8VSV8_FUNMO|nr:15093_t:CDS:10 [Funneliformis mosseae]